MSKTWTLCKVPKRMPPRGELLSYRHIPFTLWLPPSLLEPPTLSRSPTSPALPTERLRRHQTLLFLPSRWPPYVTRRATEVMRTMTNTFSSLATFKDRPIRIYLGIINRRFNYHRPYKSMLGSVRSVVSLQFSCAWLQFWLRF
jgi:hypothetical protein